MQMGEPKLSTGGGGPSALDCSSMDRTRFEHLRSSATSVDPQGRPQMSQKAADDGFDKCCS